MAIQEEMHIEFRSAITGIQNHQSDHCGHRSLQRIATKHRESHRRSCEYPCALLEWGLLIVCTYVGVLLMGPLLFKQAAT